MMHLNRDLAEVLFRILFSLIFIGLGAEHIVADDLIQNLMPQWIPMKRMVSILCGIWLLGWGGMVFLGWQLRYASLALGAFLVVVTLVVHLPGLFQHPVAMGNDCVWMWDVLQRSNLAKNLCLLGVCFLLLHHETGCYSFRKLLSTVRSK